MALVRKIHGSNGSLLLAPGMWGLISRRIVHGGPYRNRPSDLLGVCLLEKDVWRQQLGEQLWLPIPDFGVPTADPALVEEVLRKVLWELLMGREVYVGCAGGLGRTGLFLALLAKADGVADPVRYVRQVYNRGAVETRQQEEYVAAFDIHAVRRWHYGVMWRAAAANAWLSLVTAPARWALALVR